MNRGYLLGVDIGTYSSKGVLTDTEGVMAASHTVPHEMSMPAPGHFEHDADGVWWHDFVEIVRELLSQSGVDPKRILGIGTSAIGPCVLPVDENGKPLRPGILYGIDSRASEEIEYLNVAVGKEAILQKSGTNLDSQSTGPKILWIRNNEPKVYEKTKYFLTGHSYLVYKLTGTPSIDVYSANCFAPLFDIETCGWNEDTARHVTPVERLPKTYWSCEVVGGVTKLAAKETGLPEGIPVIAGTIDAASEAVSAGMAEIGDMMIMFGSSIFFIMKTGTRVRTQKFWSADFLERGGFAFMGGMSTAGSLTTWFRDRFAQAEVEREKAGGENAYALLAEEAAGSTPGANGLIALPYFEGERTPLQDPKAKGMLFGLGLKHTRGDVYRAVLEGVGFGIRHNLEAMRNEGVEPKRILAVGGGSKNDLWMKIVADIARIELVVPEQQIGASYGDAFMAGVGVGLFKDLKEIPKWVKDKKTVVPDDDAHAIAMRSITGYSGSYMNRPNPLCTSFPIRC